MPQQVRLFLSAVSAEFKSYRETLRRDLERPNVSVKIQEDFIVTATETVAMLDDYIKQCDAVIHLVGDMTGATAQPPSVAWIRQRYPDFGTRLAPIAGFLMADSPSLSYTQWEAWLALYHRKPLIIAVPAADAKRDDTYQAVEAQQIEQQAHLTRLEAVERYPGIRFANADRLAVEVLRSHLHDILTNAGIAVRPVTLPETSIGAQFMGRDILLAELAQSFGPVPEQTGTPATAAVLSGLGGIGKTRLALEYAWRSGEHYTARLFVGTDTPSALQSNLAALAQRHSLDLPEQADTDESNKRDAVIRWLNRHPGWLLILDNVDSEDSAVAAEDLIPQLNGGHMLITSRLNNYSNAVKLVPVDVLAENDAAAFLLVRTGGKRRQQADDSRQAGILAAELGYLPLALEQAGAYIGQRRLSFAAYAEQYRQQTESVLAWYDPRLMTYPKSVAITWQTSFDRLGEHSRHLLQRLAWLSPAPIPESLLDIPIPGLEGVNDPWADLAELEGYSLISRASDSPSFTVHKLVQEVTRRQGGDPEHRRLREMLAWLYAALNGDPQDVRDWPVFDPLAPHAIALVGYADKRGIADPTGRLMNQLWILLHTKALYAEAEPLIRRALSIDEVNYGRDHPEVAIRLNNLAQLLQATNRLAEAEPLMKRALNIDEASFGKDHPNVAIRLNNLAMLLKDTNRLAEAEPLMRRALSIDEAGFGLDHPRVASELNNLAQLLQDTNRLAEAEPLMRRALSIDEACYGQDHPNVAIRLNNLAGLLQATNRLAEAEPLMRRALSIDEDSYGQDHPNVGIRLNNLAGLLQATNRLAEAEPLMRRALSIDEAGYGQDHPDVAIDLNNLAGLFMATNRLAEAEPIMRRALVIFINSLGVDHPSSETVWQNYFAMGQALGWSEEKIIETIQRELASD